MMMKVVPLFIAIVTMLGGTWIFMDTRFAKSEELKSVANRLDYKIKYDQVAGLREQIWSLQEHFCRQGFQCTNKELESVPPKIRLQLMRLKSEQNQLESELENMRNGKTP